MRTFVLVQPMAPLLAIYTDISFASVDGIVWRRATGGGNECMGLAMMILIGV